MDRRRRRARCRLAVILFPAAAAAMTRPNLAPRGLGRVRARAPIGAWGMPGQMKILAGNSNAPLAEAIAAYLG